MPFTLELVAALGKALRPTWDAYVAHREALVPLATLAAGGVAAWVGLGQLSTARRRHEEQTKADLQRRITENYTKAVEQLGSEKLQVRIGGIYTLERISRESAEDYWTVMETLTAFVRERARWEQPDDTDLSRTEARAHKPRRRSNTDIEAVLTVLKRRSEANREREKREGWHLDLEFTDLRGTDFSGVHLEGASLFGAHLERAVLEQAHFDGAQLFYAHLEGAHLGGAHLKGAMLSRAHLEGADLYRVHLEGARLSEAHLEGADLRDARLEGAFLNGAHLEGAKLQGARLEVAHLRGAHFEGATSAGRTSKGLTFKARTSKGPTSAGRCSRRTRLIARPATRRPSWEGFTKGRVTGLRRRRTTRRRVKVAVEARTAAP